MLAVLAEADGQKTVLLEADGAPPEDVWAFCSKPGNSFLSISADAFLMAADKTGIFRPGRDTLAAKIETKEFLPEHQPGSWLWLSPVEQAGSFGPPQSLAARLAAGLFALEIQLARTMVASVRLPPKLTFREAPGPQPSELQRVTNFGALKLTWEARKDQHSGALSITDSIEQFLGDSFRLVERAVLGGKTSPPRANELHVAALLAAMMEDLEPLAVQNRALQAGKALRGAEVDVPGSRYHGGPSHWPTDCWAPFLDTTSEDVGRNHMGGLLEGGLLLMSPAGKFDL